jgi:hypothetical protein
VIKTYLRVNSERREYVTRQGDPEDRWDRDDTSTDWNFRNVYIVDENASWDFCLPFEVKQGDDVWVVAAIYSTGDSFGRDDRACVEYIDAFMDKHKARECARLADASQKGWNDHEDKKVEWVREDGSAGKLGYVPWNGYFEVLDEVRCEYLEVK